MNRVAQNDPPDAWLAAALRARAEDARPRSDCPNPARIWDAVRLQLPLDERLAIIDHTSECSACAEAWGLAAELDSAHAGSAPAMPASSRALSVFYGRSRLLIGTAAVFLVALGIAFIMFRPAARPTEDVAATLQPRDEQSAALPLGDFLLRWTPGPAGSRYDVTVMKAPMDVVAEVRNLEVTEYRVPPQQLAGVADGTRLLWRVVAHTPDGRTVSSALLAVRLQQEIASAAAGTSARRQIQLYATIVNRDGTPASSVSPEDVRVLENGVDAKVLKVEPVEWTTKVQILLDNGNGVGAANLNQLRSGVRGLIEALPEGTETTLVTTAPQPRFLVRATTDRQVLLAGIDKLAADSSVGRFVESLGEALQRFEQDKGDFSGVIVSLGTTLGDTRVLDRDIRQIYERVQKKPTTVHVVMVSAGPLASAGVVQTEVGQGVAKITNGRYEAIPAVSRIATLLPEIGAQIAKGGEGKSRQFRITAERSGGSSDERPKLAIAVKSGNVTSVTVGGR
jgi:cbb3-type cytochrome oxidase subunit 3